MLSTKVQLVCKEFLPRLPHPVLKLRVVVIGIVDEGIGSVAYEVSLLAAQVGIEVVFSFAHPAQEGGVDLNSSPNTSAVRPLGSMTRQRGHPDGRLHLCGGARATWTNPTRDRRTICNKNVSWTWSPQAPH